MIAGLEYEADEPKIKDILEAYFGHPATEKEHLHWMVFFCKHTKKLVSWCMPRYGKLYGPMEDHAAALEN